MGQATGQEAGASPGSPLGWQGPGTRTTAYCSLDASVKSWMGSESGAVETDALARTWNAGVASGGLLGCTGPQPGKACRVVSTPPAGRTSPGRPRSSVRPCHPPLHTCAHVEQNPHSTLPSCLLTPSVCHLHPHGLPGSAFHGFAVAVPRAGEPLCWVPGGKLECES